MPERQPQLQMAANVAIPEEGHGNQASCISILGIHVEGASTENDERVDRSWYKLRSNRARVHTGDAVILLIESATNDMEPAIQVEYRDNQWQYGLTHLDVADSKSELRGLNLSVVELSFPQPGRYFIYHTQHQDVEEHDQRVPQLVVSCCMNSQKRTRVLANLHDHLWAKYQSALTQGRPAAQFSSFLSSVLQHPMLRDAVVCSPWASTSDVESSESPFDCDRERDAQQLLLMHPDCPFILWEPHVNSSTGLDHAKQFAQTENSVPLSSILPSWAATVSSKVAFRIATWLGKPTVDSRSKESLRQVPIDYEKARATAASAGLSVQQIPFDFLGSVSLLKQRAVREALAPVNPNIMGVHDSIVSWRRTNGDLFYTVQSNDLRVRRYGHESHDFPETAQSGRIARLKAQLSDFLWQTAEGKKIEELFQLLSSSKTTNGIQTTNKAASVIHLRDMISHATSLGFGEVTAVLKQEWFALFRGIQTLSPPNSTGITFSSFRVFLVDPFHQFFWKQYVHRIRGESKYQRETIICALEQSFEVHERECDGRSSSNNDPEIVDFSSGTRDEELMVPWSDFLEGLKSFHSLLGLQSLPPPDCCRLLYRFDLCGNGRISTRAFQTTLLTALEEITRTTKQRDFTKARMPAKLKVAIANGHRRPDVEKFTSSEAVHKLFAARAKIYQNSSTRATTSLRADSSAASLRASANSHLARIRNLPVSHLLREGVFFRPSRQTLYQCVEDGDSTEAQVTGAEDSF